jgi:hypothetical protein
MTKGLRDIGDFLGKMNMHNKVIGIPYKMGCDRGGGDWEIVFEIIKIVFGNSPFEILICKI